MREIIFRGKRIDNGEWISGYLSDFNKIKSEFDTNIEFEIDPETVGQYIELNDKNGKEIYEGDIIYHPFYNKNCVVTFREGMFLLDNKYNIRSEDIIIKLGNIYDNPELLEGDKNE